jgi:hypothetical protein
LALLALEICRRLFESRVQQRRQIFVFRVEHSNGRQLRTSRRTDFVVAIDKQMHRPRSTMGSRAQMKTDDAPTSRDVALNMAARLQINKMSSAERRLAKYALFARCEAGQKLRGLDAVIAYKLGLGGIARDHDGEWTLWAFNIDSRHEPDFPWHRKDTDVFSLN